MMGSNLDAWIRILVIRNCRNKIGLDVESEQKYILWQPVPHAQQVVYY